MITQLVNRLGDQDVSPLHRTTVIYADLYRSICLPSPSYLITYVNTGHCQRYLDAGEREVTR